MRIRTVKSVPAFVMLLAVLMAADASGQAHPYEHLSGRDVRAGREPLTCSVRANITTLPPAIRYEADFIIVNDDADPIKRLRFRLPPSSPSLLAFDSISYRGVPLDSSEMRTADGHLVIDLPAPMAPENVALLHLAASYGPVDLFADRAVLLTQWLPLPEFGGADSALVPNDTVPIHAMRFDVTVSCDSSLKILAPGMLVNANSHYGLLPHGEGIFRDMTQHMVAADAESRYSPHFKGGRRTFIFRISRASALPLIVSPSFRYDRLITDRLSIDLFYAPSVSGERADEFSNSVYTVVSQDSLIEGTGDYELTIYASPDVEDEAYDQLLILKCAPPISDSGLAFLRRNFPKVSRPTF
jgi:hypothetical protein